MDQARIKALRAIELTESELSASISLLNELAYALAPLLKVEAKDFVEDLTFKFGEQITLKGGQALAVLKINAEQMSPLRYSESANKAHTIALELSKTSKLRLSNKQYKQLLTYYWLRFVYNLRLNLTTIVSSDLILASDIRDCFYLAERLQVLQQSQGSLLDIGTGSGVPGLLLAILLPDLACMLLDTVQKKLAFLAIVIRELELSNCELAWTRVEDFARTKARQSFDFVVSRAVSELSTLLEYSLPLTKVDGYCLCLKTSSEEKTDAKKLYAILGAKQLPSFVYPLSDERHEHLILTFQQKKLINSTFPRKFNLPRKESLDII